MQPKRYPALLSLVMVGCVMLSCAPKVQQFSFDLKGHSVFKNDTEEDTALSPEEQRCIRRRFALLHRLGGKYQQVLADVEPLNLSNQFTSAVLWCFHPKIATPPELARIIHQPETSTREAPFWRLDDPQHTRIPRSSCS